MPISRIKRDAINDGAINIAKTDNLFVNTEISGTEAARMPQGTTAQRANAQLGDLRFNTDLDQLEQYTTDGWKGISAPPTISSIDQSSIDTTSDPFTLVITGQNFDIGATATLQDNTGVTLNATTSTRNSSTQITIVYGGSQLSAIDADTPEPLIVKVTNGSGLTAKLEGSLGVDDNPVWSSPAASSSNDVFTGDSESISLSATDPETGGSITYSTSSSLPSGMSLSGSAISGTPTGGTYNASGVSYPVTVTATGADGDTTNRSFNIIQKWYDGSSSSLAATSAQAIADLGITTDGTFWIQPSGATSPYEVHCYNSIESGGWELAYRFQTTTNNTSPDASGSWGAANWSGWGVTKTQAAVDALSGNGDYSIFADNDAMSPSFVLTPFTDIMIISNRSGQTSKRAGYRFGSTVANIRDATGGTSSETYTTNVLFGSLQWLQVLDTKTSIASIDAYGGAERFGFKIRSDTGSTTSDTNFTGGFWTTSMHYGAQIGVGRENQDGGEWGGGFGGYYGGTGHFKMHGHWWNHGTQWTGGSSYDGNVFYGHSVYIRSNA